MRIFKAFILSQNYLFQFASYVALVLGFCTANSSLGFAETRSFRMGFSTWPYDITQESQDALYQTVQREGDIVLEHIEEGVPWNEALLNAPFPAEFQSALDSRKSKISRKKKILVSINPLDTSRTGLALYRTDQINQPLPEPWASYKLDDKSVQRAYFNYAKKIVSIFKPDYLVVGVEVNLLMRDKPERWAEYLRLQKSVYKALKRAYPKLPIMVSLESISLIPDFQSADSASQSRALKEILPYTDILGLSFHPFLSQYTVGPYPFDVFKALRKLAKKSIAITETSFPAEPFTIKVNGSDFLFNGSEESQNNFYTNLLKSAQKDKYKFVVGFAIRDYDPVWEAFGKTDLLLLWRDTGLFSETGAERPALSVWRKYLKHKYLP